MSQVQDDTIDLELTEEVLAGRSGAIYTIQQDEVPAMLEAIDLLRGGFRMNAETSGKTKELVKAISQLCEADPYGLTDQKQMQQQLNLSRSGLLRRIRNLESFNILKTSKPVVVNQRSRQFTKFWLDHKAVQESVITPPEANEDLDPETELLPKQNSIESQVNRTFLDHVDEATKNINVKGERFSIFYLLSAFPSGTRGEILNSILNLKLYVANDHFDLTVTPLKNGRIASIRDLQVFAAVITIIHKRLQVDPYLQNSFVFDVKEIIKELGLQNLRENKERIREALYRIRRTSLYIHNATSGIKRHLHDLFTIESDFSLISKVTCLQKEEVIEENDRVRVPDQIRVILDQDLYERIKFKDGALLTAIHKEALREINPFDYKFYLWLRRVYREYTDKESAREVTLSHLHREIEPYRHRYIFKKDIIRLIKKRRISQDSNIAQLYGYFIEPLNDQFDKFKVWTDERDQLVGKNSYAALMKSLDVKSEKETETTNE